MFRDMRCSLLVVSALMLLVGCTGNEPTAPSVLQWTWRNVDGNVCNDGSPTGMGISEASDRKLVLLLDGGGVCTDYNSCVGRKIVQVGPFGPDQLQARADSLRSNPFLLRHQPANPLTDFTAIFVPYCTGDFHVGDRTVTYINPATQEETPFQHVGGVNVEHILTTVAEAYPHLDELLVMGFSAGGVGGWLNYPSIRKHFPNAEFKFISDGGPPLDTALLPQPNKFDLSHWTKTSPVADLCADSCDNNLLKVAQRVLSNHPTDEIALLTSDQDYVNRFYLDIEGPQYASILKASLQDHLQSFPNFKAFVVSGSDHVLFSDTSIRAQNDKALSTWLIDFIEDAPVETVSPW